MPRPEFTQNPDDIKMGPAIVVYDGKQLGYTMNDSVSISLTQNTTPIQPDQASIPVADRITSMECTIDMELAKVTPEVFALLPGGSEEGITDPTGVDMRKNGKTLIIYPLDKADTRVFKFPLAQPIMNGALNFARETPSSMPLQFKAYLASAGAKIMEFKE